MHTDSRTSHHQTRQTDFRDEPSQVTRTPLQDPLSRTPILAIFRACRLLIPFPQDPTDRLPRPVLKPARSPDHLSGIKFQFPSRTPILAIFHAYRPLNIPPPDPTDAAVGKTRRRRVRSNQSPSVQSVQSVDSISVSVFFSLPLALALYLHLPLSLGFCGLPDRFNRFAHSARPGRGMLSIDSMDWYALPVFLTPQTTNSIASNIEFMAFC